MQIYNLQVGKSIRPHENPSLDALIDEFAMAINRECLIMGQLFVHTEPPPPGKSWRITRASTVPKTLMDYKEPRQHSTITKIKFGKIVITGPCCPFPGLLELARDAEQASPTNLEFRLALDKGILHQLSQHPLFGEAVAVHKFSTAGFLDGRSYPILEVKPFGFSDWATSGQNGRCGKEDSIADMLAC
jgi:hypothetical protein